MAASTRPSFPGSGRRVAHLALVGWLLAAAYLPALTFFGHYPLWLDIPGTSLYVGLPAHTSPDAHDHESHCHADASSCSDTPVPTTGNIALLAESLIPSGADLPRTGVPPRAARLLAQADVTPVSPPPRALFQI